MSYKRLVQQVFAYQSSPAAAPRLLLEELLAMIDLSYELIGLQAIGSEGAVIAAKNNCGEKVAIKIAAQRANEPGKQKLFRRKYFDLEKESENSFQKRFTEGSKLQKCLFLETQKHRPDFLYIPCVYRVSTSPGLYIEMQFVDGVSILRWIQEKNNLKYSANLFLKVLRGVNFFHDFGIVHRDIKSENILITAGEKGQEAISIVDWTMSKIAGDKRNLTFTGMRMGTLPYASPRLMIDMDPENASYSDDVFSVGVVMWEFFTSQKTPRPKNPKLLLENKEAMQKYLDDLEKDLPSPVASIFRKATTVIDENRYATIEPFLAEYENALQELELYEREGTWEVEDDSPVSRKEYEDLRKVLGGEILKLEKIEEYLLRLESKLDRIGRIFLDV